MADGDEGHEEGQGVQGLDFKRPHLTMMGHPGGFKDSGRTGRPYVISVSSISKCPPLPASDMRRRPWSPLVAVNALPRLAHRGGACGLPGSGSGKQFHVRW